MSCVRSGTGACGLDHWEGTPSRWAKTGSVRRVHVEAAVSPRHEEGTWLLGSTYFAWKVTVTDAMAVDMKPCSQGTGARKIPVERCDSRPSRFQVASSSSMPSPVEKHVDISPTDPQKQCDTILVVPGSPTSHDIFPYAW